MPLGKEVAAAFMPPTLNLGMVLEAIELVQFCCVARLRWGVISLAAPNNLYLPANEIQRSLLNWSHFVLLNANSKWMGFSEISKYAKLDKAKIALKASST